MNVALLLEMVAGGAPDRIVVGPDPGGITAAELLARARRAAALFRSSGAEHVALVDLNSEVLPICVFGAALAGLPFAPVNYRLTDEQLDGILRRLEPALVVAGPDCLPRLADREGQQLLSTEEFLDRVAADDGTDVELPFVDPEEVAILLFTSGTTGEPKAAVLRHRHLTAYILESVEFLGAGEGDCQLVSVPPYHIAGVSAVLERAVQRAPDRLPARLRPRRVGPGRS